ncbi:MAG: hypothetical protein BGO87_06720 [Flavobacteriia bacterium 40-80]|nr:MAG: hypothetical protein BGO87_06720 [Flavobacteriia bacterium 40-80]
MQLFRQITSEGSGSDGKISGIYRISAPMEQSYICAITLLKQNTMKKTILILTGIVISWGFTSCKKEGCTDPTATNYKILATKDDGSCEYASTTPPNSQPYTPSFAGTYGALVAIKTITTTSTPIGSMDASAGTAVAVFSENGGSGFVGAGTVSVDSKELALQNNNSYVYMIKTSEPTGIDYSNTVSWTGSGGAWPAFNATTNQGFSTIGTITTGNPKTSENYTLATNQVTNADSVLFALYGSNSQVTKILPGNTTSYTFSASEISAAGKGTGLVQVVGLKYDLQSINSKDYYLINETVRTKSVTIE